MLAGGLPHEFHYRIDELLALARRPRPEREKAFSHMFHCKPCRMRLVDCIRVLVVTSLTLSPLLDCILDYVSLLG